MRSAVPIRDSPVWFHGKRRQKRASRRKGSPATYRKVNGPAGAFRRKPVPDLIRDVQWFAAENATNARILETPRSPRAVDAFEIAGAVEGVQPAARPKRPRTQECFDLLREAVIVEPGNAREPERRPIALAAVLK